MATVSRAITRPNSFIYTLMGDLVRYYGGEIWVGSLTRLLAEFGLSEPAVRQAVSRMSRQGWISARKVGNRSYYAMTDRGRARVDAVTPRIYDPPATQWDGRWRMLAYTIPEIERGGRDALRKDLAVLGFAPLSAALFLSPLDALDAAREAARTNGVIDYIDTFVAESCGPRSDRDIIARCWDVAAIAADYRTFTARLGEHERERATELSDAQAFVEREWLVHDYRKFIYRDPGLPLALLPSDWPARDASSCFRAAYDRLTPQAIRYFEAIFESAPDAPNPRSSPDLAASESPVVHRAR